VPPALPDPDRQRQECGGLELERDLEHLAENSVVYVLGRVTGLGEFSPVGRLFYLGSSV
jgi:hypothetical protein